MPGWLFDFHAPGWLLKSHLFARVTFEKSLARLDDVAKNFVTNRSSFIVSVILRFFVCLSVIDFFWGGLEDAGYLLEKKSWCRSLFFINLQSWCRSLFSVFGGRVDAGHFLFKNSWCWSIFFYELMLVTCINLRVGEGHFFRFWGVLLIDPPL